MRSQALRFEVRQRVQQASIDFSLIRDIAAMSITLVALPRLILDKDAAFATVRELTRDDLIRESAHERRKRSSEDFHRTLFMAVAAQGSGEPECQSPRIREQRGGVFKISRPAFRFRKAAPGQDL